MQAEQQQIENPAVVRRGYKEDDNQVYMVGDNSSRTGVVLIGDIFGMLDNSKRFADRLAKEGHLVVMPDFFMEHALEAEKFNAEYLQSEEWKEYMEFITKYEHFRPKALRAVALLRKMGCKKVTSIGLCWGARLAFDLARDGVTDACATAHPAFFTAASVKAAKKPVCVLPSKDDPDMEDVEKAVSKHKQKPSVFKSYDKLSHGFFGCRFDHDNATEEEKRQLDAATKVIVDFLRKAMK